MFKKHKYSKLTFPVTNLDRKMVTFIIINCFFSIVIFLFMLNMTLFHYLYLFCNVTRIERIQTKRINSLVESDSIEISQKYPYDLGLFQNIKQVFGNNYWLWWLCSSPIGDGTEFTINQPNDKMVYWPPPELMLYDKYPNHSKEYYSGIISGLIQPLNNLEENQINLHDNNKNEQNLRKVNKSLNKSSEKSSVFEQENSKKSSRNYNSSKKRKDKQI